MIKPNAQTLVFEHRYLVAMRILGIRERHRLILNTLYVDPAPWPIQKLANRVILSRSSVRSTLKEFEAMTWTREVPRKGWTLTEAGKGSYDSIFAECVAIANGEQRGFSAPFLERLRAFCDLHGLKYPDVPDGAIL